MNTKVSTLSLVLSLVGALAVGGCDKGEAKDAKAETKDGKAAVDAKAGDAKLVVEGKDGAAKVEGADGSVVQADGSTTIKANGNQVVVGADGSLDAKSNDGNHAVVGADGTIDAKSNDGNTATIKSGAGGQVIDAKSNDGTEATVTNSADGSQTVKSGNTEVKMGKDGKVEISGVPGL
jgi:hypothetical protein